MAVKLVILASLALVCILLVLSLSFTVYIAYIHWIYRHIPGPARDNFFLGNRPFFSKEKKLRGKGFAEICIELYQKYGPVFVVWVYHIPVVHLSDPGMAKKCLVTLNSPKAARVYSLIGYVYGARFAGRGILTELNHEVWQRKRSSLNPAFHRKYLIFLMGAFNASCDALVKKLRKMADGKTEVRMLDEFARVTLDVIGKVGFSISLDTIENPDSAFPTAVSKSLLGVQESFQNPFWRFKVSTFPFQNSVIEAVKFIRGFAKSVIEERIRSIQNGDDTPKDILEHILKEAGQNPEITMEDLIDDFLTVFVAGQETTSNQLSFTLYEILRHPHIEERIVEEVDNVVGNHQFVDYNDLGNLEYLGQTLKEGLRMHPPIGSTQRVLQQEVHFGGYKIPAKSFVTISCVNIHSSAEFWDRPEEFDPERFSPSQKGAISQWIYFPFSLGPRSCIGKTLAQFEAKVLMARLFQEFKFQLLPGQTAKVEECLTRRPRDGVVCTVLPRK